MRSTACVRRVYARERASLTCLPTLTLPVHTVPTIRSLDGIRCVHARFNGVTAFARVKSNRHIYLSSVSAMYLNSGILKAVFIVRSYIQDCLKSGQGLKIPSSQ